MTNSELDFDMSIKRKKLRDRLVHNLNSRDARKQALVDSHWFSNNHQAIPRNSVRSAARHVPNQWVRFHF
jgi:hypothetical protein